MPQLTPEQIVMNKRWCDALEIGGYKQGTGALCSADGHCCLGVAMDLLVRSGIGEWIETPEALVSRTGQQSYKSLGGDVWEDLPPWDAAQLYGWTRPSVELDIDDGKREEATLLNDEKNYTFSDIAWCIRQTFDLPTPQQEASRLQAQYSDGQISAAMDRELELHTDELPLYLQRHRLKHGQDFDPAARTEKHPSLAYRAFSDGPDPVYICIRCTANPPRDADGQSILPRVDYEAGAARLSAETGACANCGQIYE